MTRPAGANTTPVSLRLDSEDLCYLRSVFPSGYQTKLKELIHSYVLNLQAEGEETLKELERRYPSG